MLYGTDADQYTAGREPTDPERARFVERMESWYRLDFAYYAMHGVSQLGGRDLECPGLPREVLEKFYYRNAQRLMPGLQDE